MQFVQGHFGVKEQKAISIFAYDPLYPGRKKAVLASEGQKHHQES